MTESKNLKKWQEIWTKKGKVQTPTTLLELIHIDGFDSGISQMTEAIWYKLVDKVHARLALTQADHILEVGCGAGALLIPLAEKGLKCVGVDYSASLIEVAQNYSDKATFEVAEISQLPFEAQTFNKVFLHSVSQYLGNLEYAEKAFQELLRVCRQPSKIAFFDVPDFAKKEASEATRAAEIGVEKYKALYSELQHLYYPKEWFEELGQKYGYTATIQDNDLTEYGSSQFRFDVVLSK